MEEERDRAEACRNANGWAIILIGGSSIFGCYRWELTIKNGSRS